MVRDDSDSTLVNSGPSDLIFIVSDIGGLMHQALMQCDNHVHACTAVRRNTTPELSQRAWFSKGVDRRGPTRVRTAGFIVRDDIHSSTPWLCCSCPRLFRADAIDTQYLDLALTRVNDRGFPRFFEILSSPNRRQPALETMCTSICNATTTEIQDVVAG